MKYNQLKKVFDLFSNLSSKIKRNYFETPYFLLTFLYAQEGFTALIWAAYEGHIAVMQALLEAGADINIQETVSHLNGLK